MHIFRDIDMFEGQIKIMLAVLAPEGLITINDGVTGHPHYRYPG